MPLGKGLCSREGTPLIDSHAHLYFDRFDADRDEVIARAREVGVSAVINIGIDVDSSRQSVALATVNGDFFAAVGLHPTSKVADLDADLVEIEALARENPGRVVAIGEIGLDYYWKDVPREEQKPRLVRQLVLSRGLALPVIFHCRDALEDLLAILEAEDELPPGVFHCFSGGPAEVERALQLGFHLSFAGNVTFPKATGLHAALRSAPVEKLLLETDSPFLAPQPRRGKRNEPAFVRYTRDFIAGVKGVSPEDLERTTDATTRKLFGI